MKKTEISAILLIFLVIILSCLPLFRNIHNINLHWDWQQMLSYYRADRTAILQYHQLPLRTFYFGGGYPIIANPQDGFLNPFFIPVLIFGEVIGMKLNLLLAILIGAAGMYYLTRRVMGYHYLGAAFSTLVFCLGGHLHRLLVRGQDYMSIFWFFLPAILAFFIKSKHDKRFIFFSIIILTAFITQAGPYFSPVLFFIFLFSVFEAVSCKNRKFAFDGFYIKNLFFILIIAFLLGAVKIFPMFELLSQNPRVAEGYNPFFKDVFNVLYKTFFTRHVNFPFEGAHWIYFYLGYIPFIFLLASGIVYWNKAKRLVLLLIIFSFLSFSPGSKLDLFKFLWQLPVFHSIESPLRYFTPIVIFLISLLAGMIFSIADKFNQKFVKAIFIAAIIITAADLFIINGTRGVSFPVPISPNIEQGPFFQVLNTKPGDKVSASIPKNIFLTRSWEWTLPSQYELMLQNIGKINWYGNIHLDEYTQEKFYVDWNGIESADPLNYKWFYNPKYKGEIYFLNNPQNKAEFKYFSPNKIIVEAKVFEPDTLVINQNYDKYWRSDFLRPFSHDGLLALNINRKGTYLIKFEYVPLNFYFGLIVSLATLLFVIISISRIKKYNADENIKVN